MVSTRVAYVHKHAYTHWHSQGQRRSAVLRQGFLESKEMPIDVYSVLSILAFIPLSLMSLHRTCCLNFTKEVVILKRKFQQAYQPVQYRKSEILTYLPEKCSHGVFYYDLAMYSQENMSFEVRYVLWVEILTYLVTGESYTSYLISPRSNFLIYKMWIGIKKKMVGWFLGLYIKT